MSKKCRFRGPFDKWHGKRAEALLKSGRQHLYHIYWSLSRQFRLTKRIWVICKILGLFVNPLTTDDKYCLFNKSNLLQHFKIQLSQNRKTFSEFFFVFCKSRFYFQIFTKRDDPQCRRIFQLTDSEKRG